MKIFTTILMSLIFLLPTIDDISQVVIASPERDEININCDSLKVIYPLVFKAILNHLLTNETVVNGDYQKDSGDATCYAPPVLLAHGMATGDTTETNLARAIIEREYYLINNFLANSSEALIGGLGLTEVYDLNQDQQVAKETRYLIEIVDALYESLNENGLLPKSMTALYGQTASTAIVVALELQYFIKVDPSDINRRNRALAIVQKIEAAAYDSAGFYIFEADNKELYLYPNVAMMLVHSLAYHVSEDIHHLKMARSLLPAIDPLYHPELDAYLSRAQGADNVVTLASHNYLVLALKDLFDETGDTLYLNKAQRTIDFIINKLYSDGIAYDNLTNNQKSGWYCTGCNFQLLFVLWQMGEYLHPTSVSVEDNSKPKDCWLSSNYPNPFNSETAIEYHLPRASEVEISIFNLQGQKVATLVKDHQTAGYHKISWNGRDEYGRVVASGVYFYQLKAGEVMITNKMLLVR
jgi:hypothetical protein